MNQNQEGPRLSNFLFINKGNGKSFLCMEWSTIILEDGGRKVVQVICSSSQGRKDRN